MPNYSLTIEIHDIEDEFVDVVFVIRNNKGMLCSMEVEGRISAVERNTNMREMTFNECNGRAAMTIEECEARFEIFDALASCTLVVLYQLTNEECEQFQEELEKIKYIQFGLND